MVESRITSNISASERNADKKEDLLFRNPTDMAALTKIVYDKAREGNDYSIHPASRYCPVVTPIVDQELKARGLKSEQMEHEAPHNRGSVSHAFVRVGQPRSPEPKWVADWQYQQFVPEEKRGELPDYMVFSYKTPREVEKKLAEYHIPEKYHSYWTTELFWDA